MNWICNLKKQLSFRLLTLYVYGTILNNDTRGLIIKITESGSEDFMDEGTEYYMILKPLKDENEVREEIEKEKQYNKEHGILVRQTFPFPIGEEE